MKSRPDHKRCINVRPGKIRTPSSVTRSRLAAVVFLKRICTYELPASIEEGCPQDGVVPISAKPFEKPLDLFGYR